MSKLRKAANGQTCQVRLPGCLHDHGVVLAHYRMAGTCGMGYKPNDLQGAWACFACHKLVDSTRDESVRLDFAEGVFRTQSELLKMGMIKL